MTAYLMTFLIARYEAHCLDQPSVNLGNDYLSFRKQRTKIGFLFNDCAHVTWGIRQRSILGTLFRSIFINNIFFFVGKICYMQICQDDSL